MDPDRSDIICTELIEAALKKHLGEGYDLVGYRCHPGTLKGDNYMGDLFTVEVDLKNPDGELKTLHWMLKALKQNPVSGGKHIGRMMQVFPREAAVYTDLMPNLNRMDDLKYCQLVHVDETPEKEALILENMKYLGWVDALNKKSGLTLPYVHLAIEWLAKFHALSYVLIRTGVSGIEEWQEKHTWSYTFTQKQPEEFAQFHDNMIAFVMEQQEKFKLISDFLSRDPSASHNYKAFMDKMVNIGTLVVEMRGKAQQPRGKFVTLNHLDPWFNNMLFQHDDKNHPTDILLLDFQLVGVTHPGNDLVYFLTTSTTPELRKDHLEGILSLYHQTLHAELEKVGHVGVDYTLEDVKEDYKIGLYLVPSLIVMAMPLMLASDGEDTMDIGGLDFTDTKKVQKMGEDSNRKFEEVLTKNLELRNRIKGALDEFIDADII